MAARVWPVSVAMLLLAIWGCGERLPTYRYKITVEVETPEGLRRGSAVREITTIDQGKGFPGPEAGGVRHKVRGEAVAVDLPNGGTLFALLTGAEAHRTGDAEWIADATLRDAVEALPAVGPQPTDGNFAPHRQKILAALQGEQLRGTVPPTFYPVFVHFRNIDDPTSVEQIDPDDLEAKFGEGYALKQINIETTDEQVTNEIEARLKWLVDQAGALIKRPSGVVIGDMPIGGRLNEGDFIKENSP